MIMINNNDDNNNDNNEIDYPNCNNEILHNNGVPIVRYDVSSLPVGPALPAEYYPYIPHQYPDGVSAAAYEFHFISIHF